MIGLFAGLFLGPLLLAALGTRLMISLAPRIGLMDHPAARKVHVKVTPMGGGVAIFVANLLTLGAIPLGAWLIGRHPEWFPALPDHVLVHRDGILLRTPLLATMFGFATVQMLTGLADDWKRGGLSYQVRLLIEAGLVLALVGLGVCVSLYGLPKWVAAAVTLLWVVGLTNAFNFLDNMDGLSAGVAFWASVFFAAVALQLGSLFAAGTFVILAGSLLGFLIFNWNPARIFMGDAGSNFLGFWIATLTVVCTYSLEGSPHVTLAAPLCILAVPIYDSSTVILLRLSQGRSPFHPDKQHLSHRLVDLGFRPKHAVMLIHFLAIGTGIAGLLLYYVRPEAAWLVLAQVFCMLGVIALLEYAAWRKMKSANGTAP